MCSRTTHIHCKRRQWQTCVEKPNPNQVADNAAAQAENPATPEVDDIEDDLDKPITDAERQAVREGRIIDEQGNTIGTITSRGT